MSARDMIQTVVEDIIKAGRLMSYDVYARVLNRLVDAIEDLEQQRQLVPLTEEQIRAMPEWFPSHEAGAVLSLIRAVERAHGIGGNDEPA